MLYLQRMPSVKLHARLIAALMLGGSQFVAGAVFLPPNEGPIPFRRDQLPLDVETISGLSRGLEILAGEVDAKTPEDFRHAAQILALSIALDPGNTRSKNRLDDFSSGAHTAEPDTGKSVVVRADIRSYIGWLATPEAGSAGNALSLCLEDILAGADAGAEKEKGAWNGWVPAIAAYQSGGEMSDEPEEDPEEEPSITATSVKLASAEMVVPLWTPEDAIDSPDYKFSPETLQMKVEQSSKSGVPFSVEIVGAEKSPVISVMVQTTIKLLEAKHGTLPPDLVVRIGGEGLEASLQSKRAQPIAGAVAVFADAVITGNPPDAMVLGEFSDSGGFAVSPGFWEQLQSLGPGQGERLILPVDSMDYLTSVLAFENPGFFIEREVLLAANFQQVMAMASKVPPEPLAAAMVKFKEIRDKAPAQSLGQYISNNFVRRRLLEIEQQFPNHASAKLLGLQAAGNRPTLISRQVLISEIRKAIEPVRELVKTRVYSYDVKDFNRLAPAYESSRVAVDRLDRYVKKEDREILVRAQELVTSVRTLERASRARGSVYETTTPFADAYAVMTRLHAAMLKDLNMAIGDRTE